MLRFGETFEAALTASSVDSNFREHVNRYVKSTMGSRDLYCCPLCYTVAYNRIGYSSRRSGKTASMGSGRSKIAERYRLEFDLDPLSILMEPTLPVASTFCFKTAAKVKGHLRTDHGVDTKPVSGNDLYNRFQVRTQDGLLQRYVKNVECHDRTAVQGYLQRYWHSGNNFDFVHLLDLVDTAEYFRSTIQGHSDDTDDESVAEATEYLEKGFRFFRSFAKDAKPLCELVSGPYQLNDSADLEDFIAEEGDGESDVELSNKAAYREQEMKDMQEEMDADDEYLRELNRRFSEQDGKEDEEEDVILAGHNAFEDASEEDDNGQTSEDQDKEEEDPWMSQKRQSMQKRFSSIGFRGHRKRRSGSRGSRSSAANFHCGNEPEVALSLDDSSDDEDEIAPATQPSARRRKRFSIEDSDGE